MKYLKTFENTIKSTDKSALDNPLKLFGEKIEETLNDISGMSITMHFTDEQNKKIFIRGIAKNEAVLLIDIYISTYNIKNTKFRFDIYLKYNRYRKANYDYDSALLFLDFISEKFKKYKITYYNTNNIWQNYEFPLEELNNILIEIDEFSMFMNAKKYNL
jgi:hypothetical protein